MVRDKMIVEVMERGAYISKAGERLRIKKGGELIYEVAISKVEGLIIGKGVALSSDSLILCAQNNVPVFFSLSSSTYFLPSTSLSKPLVRISQMKLSSQRKKEFIYKLIKYKLLYQKEVAALFGFNLTFDFDADFSLPFEYFLERVMNKEALFAKEYWNSFSSIFRGFKRVKLFAEDSLNKSLNYGYGILKYAVEKAVLSAGLDPYIGILHATKDYRESFIFDVMEPFRPFVDFCVFSFLKEKEEEEFELFKRDFARTVVKFFKEKNFLFEGNSYDFQRALLLQCRAFGNFFTEGKKFRIMKVIKWSLEK